MHHVVGVFCAIGQLSINGLEIAKEYSTPKSSIFINGILDNLVKEFQAENKIKKTGRGLM